MPEAVETTKQETPLDAFRRSAGFQIMFVLHSGLEVGRAIDHLCASAEKFGAALREWQPIETAPKTGEEILVGHGNSVWSDRWIAYGPTEDSGYWSECGPEEHPTHWMPLPDPPTGK